MTTSARRAETGCLIWTGGLDSWGYGAIHVGGRLVGAHRAAYETFVGPIPLGMQVQHLCNVRDCIEPTHLAVGSPAENMAYCAESGRTATGDRNAARLYPERLARGPAHPARRSPERLARGDRVAQSKLSDEQVLEIRARYATGAIGSVRLAREYGVAKPTILAIVHRRTWTHL